MNITPEQIKSLRDATGISVMQCKKALEEAGGDSDKAIEILKKKSGEIAIKKADRTLGAGTIAAYLHGGQVGAMVELQTETDFVAKNDEFKTLAYDIAMHVAASNPLYIDSDSIPAEAKAKAEELYKEEVEKLDKPADMKSKIMEGKLNAYFAERTLLAQPFIKNPDITVSQLIEQGTQKFGEKIRVGKFSRMKVLEA
ncbi:MAG: elongation factor Ts [Candidatus Paceibacterota bacterium]|jgi:elongation factor Ts